MTATLPPPAPRSWIERLWSSVAERGRPFAAVPNDTVPQLERARLLAQALLSGRGEASGAALARELHNGLARLKPEERLEFQRYLATDFLPDPEALRRAVNAWLADPNAATSSALSQTAEPPRQELLRRMNLSPGGTAALVAMRKDLLGQLRAHPELKPLDDDLRHLFASWFNRGFLELRRIDWQTPAAVLEKLITYEAVHEIHGWADLRRRLAPDRRCFAFFHPALPGEPLIFVEVALTQGLAEAVQPLLAPEASGEEAMAHAATADTAIFYSISNCQEGLRGVSFGNFLIKQVVEELRAERPSLHRFSTLSPVPGFRRWLDKRLDQDGVDLLRPEEARHLSQALGQGETDTVGVGMLRAAVHTDGWWKNPGLSQALRAPLLRACAAYLTKATAGQGALDPVARFHLGNGARLERINWLGNTAARGIQESFGIMVNYLYDLPRIEAHHEAYVREGAVARSGMVNALLAPVAPKRGVLGLVGLKDAG